VRWSRDGALGLASACPTSTVLWSFWLLHRDALGQSVIPGAGALADPTVPLGTSFGRRLHERAVCGKPSCRAFPAVNGMGAGARPLFCTCPAFPWSFVCD
jgi:hypothetical protein